MNKILVFWGLAVFAVLLIENMVIPSTAFVLWATSKWYILVIASTLVWFSIWFWLKWYTSSDSKEDDSEIDF